MNECSFDRNGLCMALACFSNYVCNSRDANGSPIYCDAESAEDVNCGRGEIMTTIREAIIRCMAGHIDLETVMAIVQQEMEKACEVTPEMVDIARDEWSRTLRPCKQCPFVSCEVCYLQGMAKMLTSALKRRARGE